MYSVFQSALVLHDLFISCKLCPYIILYACVYIYHVFTAAMTPCVCIILYMNLRSVMLRVIYTYVSMHACN